MTIHNKYIVEDFPEDYLKSIAIDARQPYTGPWMITLKPYILQPFMGAHILRIFINKTNFIDLNILIDLYFL